MNYDRTDLEAWKVCDRLEQREQRWQEEDASDARFAIGVVCVASICAFSVVFPDDLMVWLLMGFALGAVVGMR